MNNDFIRIKTLDGELKLSHKKKDLGLTVSTEELVIQKPHVNYHVKLQDIVSILPAAGKSGQPVQFVHSAGTQSEVIRMHADSGGLVRLFAKQAVVHNRSGMFPLKPMEFVLPMVQEMRMRIAEYGGLLGFGESDSKLSFE